MSSITTRVTAGGGATVKNAPLTNAEIDNNFINLNVDKVEKTSNLSDLSNADTALTNLGGTTVGTAVFKATDAATARTAIGAQEADANTAKLNVAQSFSAAQTFTAGLAGTTVSVSGNILTSGGSVSDSKGDVRRVIGNSVSTGYNTVLADAGKTIFMNGGQIGITNGIYSSGDVITVVNYSGALGYMYMNTPTAYISGSAAAKGSTNVTIRPCGVVTVIFINASHCFISGAVY